MMLQCKSDAISGKTLDSEQARFLMDIKDEYLSLLASSADEITREINGIGVDVEQLHNIKKNMCSEDRTSCLQLMRLYAKRMMQRSRVQNPSTSISEPGMYSDFVVFMVIAPVPYAMLTPNIASFSIPPFVTIIVYTPVP